MTIQMPERGTFVVPDDRDGVVATALAIVTSPHNAPLLHRHLAPGGDGIDDDLGWISRVGSGDEDEDDAPEDTWTACRLPDARVVIEGAALRALVVEALSMRLSCPRTVTMNAHGSFTVTDDQRGTIANALTIATAPQHAELVERALQPGGNGLRIETFGSVSQVTARELLNYPFDEDPSLDPSSQELWRLYRERDARFGPRAEIVITGDELRGLVKQAIALRTGFAPAPLKLR